MGHPTKSKQTANWSAPWKRNVMTNRFHNGTDLDRFDGILHLKQSALWRESVHTSVVFWSCQEHFCFSAKKKKRNGIKNTTQLLVVRFFARHWTVAFAVHVCVRQDALLNNAASSFFLDAVFLISFQQKMSRQTWWPNSKTECHKVIHCRSSGEGVTCQSGVTDWRRGGVDWWLP